MSAILLFLDIVAVAAGVIHGAAVLLGIGLALAWGPPADEAAWARAVGRNTLVTLLCTAWLAARVYA